MEQIPFESSKLIEELDKAFSHKYLAPRMGDTIEQIYFKMGQRAIVDWLIIKLNQQNDSLKG